MSNISSLQSAEKIDEVASLWITRLDRGLTEQEHAALTQWLEASPDHKDAFFEMAEAWDNTEILSSLSNICSIDDIESHKYEKYQKKSTNKLLAIAATIFFAIAIYGYQYYNPFFSESDRFHQEITTSTSFTPAIKLPDGSTMHVNINSRVNVKYSKLVRHIVLLKGEVNLDVVSSPSRPMVVSTADKHIRAIGTAFNVRHNGKGSELIVTEGRVIIGSADTFEDIKKPVNIQHSYVPVSGGQKAKLNTAKTIVEDISTNDIRVSLAWKKESLIFTGQTLEEAINEISRYTGSQFIFEDESTKKIRVAGVYSTRNIQGLLTSLKDNFGIEGEIRSNNIIHLKQKK